MASNRSICGVCENCQITKSSLVWYSQYDKRLCGDCKKNHDISKEMKNYETLSFEENKKIPTGVLQNATVCKIHNEKYEFFCTRHDCPCCKKCWKSHNDCKGLTEINELLKNVKTSNTLYDIEHTLLEIVQNIKRLSTNRKQNLTFLEIKKREIEADIKQARNKINDQLDKLQDDLMKELMAVEQKESRKIQKLLFSLSTKEKYITECHANVAYIKQHASELQTYLVMKHIEKDILAEEQFIQSLAKSDTINQIDISFQINKSLQQITSGGQKFGDINVSFDQCNFPVQKRKDKQAQVIVDLPTIKIGDLTLTLQKRITTELEDVSGCCVIPDGRMVFSCNHYYKVIVFKTDGSKDFEINKIEGASDVVFIGNDSIAVSSGYLDNIYIINLKTQLRKTIKVRSNNGGLVYKDGHLIYCAGEKGIQMINLSDESITNVLDNKLSDFAYVTTFGDKLFYTDPDNHSVTCCDYHGNIIWTFCNTSVLASPFGISVTNNGILFVIGFRTSSLVAISPHGLWYEQISSHRVSESQVLRYNQSTNTMLVAGKSENACLYKVK